jgi:hypothetical protein
MGLEPAKVIAALPGVLAGPMCCPIRLAVTCVHPNPTCCRALYSDDPLPRPVAFACRDPGGNPAPNSDSEALCYLIG